MPLDRRREIRLHVELEVFLNALDNVAQERKADLVNLSLGGGCVQGARGYQAGQQLALDIECGSELLNLPGAVAWCRPKGAQLGIAFVGLPSEPRLRLEDLVWLLSAVAQ